jgi:poly(3-hydroxybutyrate) depolymerase
MAAMKRLLHATALMITFGVITSSSCFSQSSAPIEKNVSFSSDAVSFPAILTLPSEIKVKPPIVVMLSGSGPQDEDEAQNLSLIFGMGSRR